MSSKDGMAPSTASSADTGVTPGPARSRLRRNATSTSTPSAANRLMGIVSPPEYTPEPSMKPSTGSLTP